MVWMEREQMKPNGLMENIYKTGIRFYNDCKK